MQIDIKRLDMTTELPFYAHSGDAAMDLCASVDMVLLSDATAKVPTGIALAIPDGYCGLVWDRSGLAANHSLHCFAGVIDSGYRGEICVVIRNFGKETFPVKKGMRIAQVLIQPVVRATLREVDMLPSTERSKRGFGSTG